MLFREIILVYSEIHMKPINIKVALLIVYAGGTFWF
jgi:hypothetical protein